MRNLSVLSWVQTVPMQTDDRVGANLDHTIRLLEESARYDPDFVCFPEYVVQLRYQNDGHAREEVARPVPGDITDAVGERAAALDSYVLLPMLEEADGGVYNSVVLLDPNGNVEGTARKLAPTRGEMDAGTRPGSDVTVWDTERGRIGVVICWDTRYDELGLRLAQEDADLVFCPTTDDTHERFVTWAKYYGYHAAVCSNEGAKMVTPTGSLLGWTDPREGNPKVELAAGENGRTVAGYPSYVEVNTDCRVYGRYQNRDVIDELAADYGDSLSIHQLPGTGNVVVESRDESVTMTDVEREYDLETMFAYEDRIRSRLLDTDERPPLLDARDRE